MHFLINSSQTGPAGKLSLECESLLKWHHCGFQIAKGTTRDKFIGQLVSWFRLVSSALQFEMDINMSPLICMGGGWGGTMGYIAGHTI